MSCIFVFITYTNVTREATLRSVTVSQPCADSICLSLNTNKRELEWWAKNWRNQYSLITKACRLIILPSCTQAEAGAHFRLVQGWRTYSTCAQNGKRKDFLATRHSLLSRSVVFTRYFAHPASLCSKEYVYVYTYISDCLEFVYNHRCYQIILRVRHFYTDRERWEVLTGYLSLESRSDGEWANTWHWTKCFTVFFPNKK